MDLKVADSYVVANYATLTLITLGIAASVYAYYVEKSHEIKTKGKAACDISEKISCSRVFTSRWVNFSPFSDSASYIDYIPNRKWL